jgi:hypothetical protein
MAKIFQTGKHTKNIDLRELRVKLLCVLSALSVIIKLLQNLLPRNKLQRLARSATCIYYHTEGTERVLGVL